MRLGTILVVISYAFDVVYGKQHSYIISLRNKQINHRFMQNYVPEYVYESIGNLSLVVANLTDNALNSLSYEQDIVNIEPNYEINIALPNNQLFNLQDYNIFSSTQDPTVKVQKNAPLHLDRINNPGLDGNYYYQADGSSVTVVSFDTGINPYHKDFAPNRVLTDPQYSFSRYGDIIDRHSHGTFTASNAAGVSSGAAKGANIVPFKILNDQGKGLIIDAIVGIEDLRKKIKTVFKGKKVIALFSLESKPSAMLAQALQGLTKDGAVVVVAAGNQNQISCNNGFAFASKNNSALVAVGALAAIDDAKASFSNYGDCTQFFVKGESIPGASYLSNSTYIVKSGTSMAAAIAAGMMATLWQQCSILDNQGVVAKFLSLAERNTPTFNDESIYPDPFIIGALEPIKFPQDLKTYSANGAVLNSYSKDWPEFMQLPQAMLAGKQYILHINVAAYSPNGLFSLRASTIADRNLINNYNQNLPANVPVLWKTFVISRYGAAGSYLINSESMPLANLLGAYAFNFSVKADNIFLNINFNDSQIARFVYPYQAHKFFSLSTLATYKVEFNNIAWSIDNNILSLPQNINLINKSNVAWQVLNLKSNNSKICLSFKVSGIGALNIVLNNMYTLSINTVVSLRGKFKKYTLCVLDAQHCITVSKPLINAQAKSLVNIEATSNGVYLSIGAKALYVSNSSVLLANEANIAFGAKNMKITKLTQC